MAKYVRPSTSGLYTPVFTVLDFWMTRDNWIQVNDTLPEDGFYKLELSFEPQSLFKFQFFVQFEESMKMQNSLYGGSNGDSDTDEIKRMLTETNPYLLGLTMIVSMLHTIFDFLAFKNDISFWKNRKTLVGISVRTVAMNVVCQLIIVLYLYDNNDTSWLILFSCAIGLAIDIWKLSRAVRVSVIWTEGNRLPTVNFQERDSYTKSKTKLYDTTAMRYLYWALVPLMICYFTYSLIYLEHKSFYSWIVSSLAGTVYTFGFIMMTPQLFINYKLKSVSHLPWRVFVYKALNTVIDDLFAFIIKMPMMHRLSCFRDDIIFVIYIYQRWIYPVDITRTEGMAFDDSDPNSDPTHSEGNNNPNALSDDSKEKIE